MHPRVADYDFTGLVARGTIIVAPLIAFNAFPVRGAVSIAMALPVAILAAAFVTRPVRRTPSWEFALVALLGLSLIWGDEPDYTGIRLRAAMPVVVATILAANLLRPRTALRCLKISLAIMVLSATVLIIISPAARVADGYSGLALHGQFAKNSFGGILALSLLLVVCSWTKRSIFLAIPLVVLIVLNQSSTAWVLIVTLLAAIVVMSLLSRRAASVSTMIWIAVSGAVLTVILVLSLNTFFLNLLGKDPTLSSRTDIWAACWTEIKRSPLLGYGAFTFLDSDSKSPVTLRIWSHFTTYYLPPHPHNGLLDVWGQLGLVGVVIFAGFAINALRSGVAGARLRDRISLTGLIGIIFILLFGLSEPTYLGNWFVISVICAAAADPVRPAQRRNVVDGNHVSVGDPGTPIEVAQGGRHRSEVLQ